MLGKKTIFLRRYNKYQDNFPSFKDPCSYKIQLEI